MYNIISCVSFFLMLILSKILEKTRKSELILRIISIILFTYKVIYYIAENVKGNISIPVEISSISYFLMFVILTFKIKKLFGVGAFFGIIAGLGYFSFYALFGFTLANSFTTKQILIGCFSHGYLLVSGLYLFKNNKFDEKEQLYIWITILAMLCWSLVFYDIEMRGITFIYYIIKPEFLFVFSNMIFNVLLLILYYGILITAFYFVIKMFFNFNKKYTIR